MRVPRGSGSIWNCGGNILQKSAIFPHPIRYTGNRDIRNAREHQRAFFIWSIGLSKPVRFTLASKSFAWTNLAASYLE
jgi:hypothetical protein